MSTEHQTSVISKSRSVVKSFLPQLNTEAAGSYLLCFGSKESMAFDPFLAFFEYTFTHELPDHPHRGFETFTYILEGAQTYQDFVGNKGTIRAGDVQWLTIGRGMVHSDTPIGEGLNRGLQLLINLPSKDKMMEPRYQEVVGEEIKKAEKDGIEVRVLAGESMGVKTPVFTRTPTMFLDVIMKPGTEWHQSIPESWNSFVYILEGEGVFGSLKSSTDTAQHLLVLGPGDGLSVWNNSTETLRFLLIAGQPLHEPVVQNRSFVMNTEAEIQKASEDFQFHKNGFENARFWSSQPVSSLKKN
ncbi:hypothetical protein NE237_025610 [Protea cynaroides]|uniref:Pirin n=1 Tax=Protea cynaroides TaxID=273540 RepID=A0A9Q0H3G8_9MAGN|nr:hypothetical protein NE237_025610 [Protea cynaroides]